MKTNQRRNLGKFPHREGYFQIKIEPIQGTTQKNFKIMETNRRFSRLKCRFHGKAHTSEWQSSGNIGS